MTDPPVKTMRKEERLELKAEISQVMRKAVNGVETTSDLTCKTRIYYTTTGDFESQ